MPEDITTGSQLVVSVPGPMVAAVSGINLANCSPNSDEKEQISCCQTIFRCLNRLIKVSYLRRKVARIYNMSAINPLVSLRLLHT